MTELELIAALEQRIAALEAKTHYMSIVEHHDPRFGMIPGVYFAGCRVGFNSDFWMRRNAGEGATVAIGNDFDQFGLYAENEGPKPPWLSGPSVCIAANAFAVGNQENRAIQAMAFNSTTCDSTFTQQIGDRVLVHRREGIEVRSGGDPFFIGRSTSDARRLW
jgi:hypothetical protein